MNGVNNMTDAEQRKAAKDFAEIWKDKGYEKGESQPFWLSFLKYVLGVEHPEHFIEFEDQVHIDKSTGFIDGTIPATHVLIEQKGVDKDLRKPIRQSNGMLLNPFQQANQYAAALPYSQRPRWIVTCNFKEFLVYDMEKPMSEPESILLKDLPKEYYRLKFLVDTGDENIRREMEVSIKAGELVGVLYDAILKQYINPDDEHSQRSLNILCVRLVFCLYAEDAGIFGSHGKFHDYLQSFPVRDMRHALIDLFKVLDTKIAERDPYLDEVLASFPYVNGGLFADENIEIPQFTDEIRNLLLNSASEDFDWSEISPTIFGAIFESTLNPETRRSGGMHYTSIENIHKVIDPLFLDDLRSELEEIKEIKVPRTKIEKINAFREKISKLTFLDPACGSGNFLTETYISLRRLENDVLEIIAQGQMMLDDHDLIKVSIGQFYGIEINDFAVTVAKSALWIAESQMMKETENICQRSLDFLPLKSYTNIVEGNALHLDWETVIPKERLNYIMGNPPFIGASMMTAEQKADAVEIFGKMKLSNSIDYVGAWYYKSAQLMQGTRIRTALVSTNSITQGEQVAPLWDKLINQLNIKIDFAYRTFVWNNEAKDKAAVHCVIIGFSQYGFSREKKLYFTNSVVRKVSNISPYLIDAPTVLVTSRAKPLSNVPSMYLGNKPADGGNLILSTDERNEIIAAEPDLKKYIFPYTGAVEYINKRERFCLWLKDVSPSEIRKSKILTQKLSAIREIRLNSTAAPTRAKADTPHLFFFISQPDSNYLLIPSTSSENRRYVPIGFLPPDVIASNSTTIVPHATLYHFGILTSNVHMAWMRTVGGRLKSDYRYSGSVVYNTFPWPDPTKDQQKKIEETAQAILDARALYPDCSLADLYDELTMPPELRKAHQRNDRAVMEAYGFWRKIHSESECVAELMKMYQKLIGE